jgi:CRISPR-associated exonuclease Cas4
MNDSDSELLMLSGLQHYLFCPRQWALIHIEQLWTENLYTAEGRLMHEQVHSAKAEQRGNIRICRTLPLVSHKLGLVGQADVVEFHRVSESENGVSLTGQKGLWKAYPVEYKRGKPKKDHSDEAQLCAQALCLEEMLHTEIPEGALFYGKEKRRTAVSFNSALRELTISVSQAIHKMLQTGDTPPAEYSKKCQSCSLLQLCLPQKCHKRLRVANYLNRILEESI